MVILIPACLSIASSCVQAAQHPCWRDLLVNLARAIDVNLDRLFRNTVRFHIGPQGNGRIRELFQVVTNLRFSQEVRKKKRVARHSLHD